MLILLVTKFKDYEDRVQLIEITVFIVVFLVVFKFFVFVSEVVSIFSKQFIWILLGVKGYLFPPTSITGGAARADPQSLRLWQQRLKLDSIVMLYRSSGGLYMS